METIVINDYVNKEQWLSTPFHSIFLTNKKSFEDAVVECNGISVDDFFDELDIRIKKRFNA